MTGLRDLLKKKEKIGQEGASGRGGQGGEQQRQQQAELDVPEFTFKRSTTETEEIIQPPTFPEDAATDGKSAEQEKRKRRHTLSFKKSSRDLVRKEPPAETGDEKLPLRPKGERRLSERLGLHRERPRSTSTEVSTNLPVNLPEAPEAVAPRSTHGDPADHDNAQREQQEAQWEKRATILAQSNPHLVEEQQPQPQRGKSHSRSRSPSISDKRNDENIQEAIRLHESGDLTNSTAMFGRLAQPNGANNALAQVLYGLALRHGWGIPPEPDKAVHYLSLAASNSASVEQQALESGMRRGGAAKGELVLAIFELANCFRHGWGVKKDAVAARQYYETAANLGDTDAMEEAAWCFLEGFGGAKDKFKAAQYLRLAEEKGSKSVGNSW
ncbi:Sel1-like repeat protein [Teratosphaeria destructans]|uniref:Sel1-like repeat protein n=1 Tax=Teratosphaeria destructans TaxID=418781 RepID=A0A9W7SNI9_9PEZI|nr:Sel1-like repeat protein [Teratosphaeria destructans]